MKRPLLCFLVTLSVQADLIEVSQCQKPTDDEPHVYSDDFKWGMTPQEIKDKYQQIYQSGKRLKRRAYLNANQEVVIKVSDFQNVPLAVMPKKFINSIKRHIEVALERGYTSAIIFPDMGHNHFFIPTPDWNRIRTSTSGQRNRTYEEVFKLDNLKMLYHTAEQLKMKDENRKLLEDRYIQWRFYTRNLVGDNKGLGKMEFLHNQEHPFNTAREYDDNHYYYGAGVNISGSKNGCFAFFHKGQKFFFDISLKDPESSVAVEPGPF